jgi:hypothetical protein
MSYTEARNMPIMYREWFIRRFVKEFEEQNAANQRVARDAQDASDRPRTIARAFSG